MSKLTRCRWCDWLCYEETPHKWKGRKFCSELCWALFVSNNCSDYREYDAITLKKARRKLKELERVKCFECGEQNIKLHWITDPFDKRNIPDERKKIWVCRWCLDSYK